MPTALAPIDQLTFADLVDKCHDAAFDRDFPANGSFLKQTRDDREYWYYRGYARALDGSPGASTLKYAGPTNDPELSRRIARFGSIKADYQIRRGLAARLRRAGLPAPLPLEGAIVQALAEAGVFRLRATLVGSFAYQTFGGLLGVKLKDTLHRTGDLDFAQYFGVAMSIDDATADIADALRRVDPTFAPTEHWNTPHVISGFRNASGFKVEFLTPNRGKPENQDHFVKMPALGGVGAQPLAYLDFLIRDPVRSVLLHDAGVGVVVPDPTRYAVHKLIVATLRNDIAKSGKDIDQSTALIDALTAARRTGDLGLLWKEAWNRGPAWRRQLAIGALRLPDEPLEQLKNAVLNAPPSEIDADAGSCGFNFETPPRKSLRAPPPRRRRTRA